MFKSIINKLEQDKLYWEQEMHIYERVVESDLSNTEASILADACRVLRLHVDELKGDIEAMALNNNYIILYIKVSKFNDNVCYSTQYRVFDAGKENLGKTLHYFNVYFKTEFKPLKSGYLQAKREDLIIPSHFFEEKLSNGKTKKPYITVLNFEEFNEDIEYCQTTLDDYI